MTRTGSVFLLAIVCLVGMLGASADPSHRLVLPEQEAARADPHGFNLVKPEAPTGAPDAGLLASPRLVEYEIRYACPGAEAVWLLWGLDGWRAPDRSCWPAGAVAKKHSPYCRMESDGETFAIRLTVPEGATLDYCFNVVSPAGGTDFWDTNGAPNRDYHSKVVAGGTALVIGQAESPGAEAVVSARSWSPASQLVLFGVVFLLLALGARALLRRTGTGAPR